MGKTIRIAFFSVLLAFVGLSFSLIPAISQAASSSNSSSSGPSTSLNWSGYAAQGGTYTGVSGTWRIPAVESTQLASSNQLSADATWVGIGGVATKDLIQGGTQAFIDQSGVKYEAFYELLPNYSVQVPLTVNGGDSISVNLNHESGNLWRISFRNNTTGQTYSTTADYASSMSSADWIEEMPSASDSFLPLDNFGSIQFTSAFATKNNTNLSMSQSGAQPITMLNGSNQVLAAPSSFGIDGTSFTVTRSANPAIQTVTSGSPSYTTSFGFGDRGYLPNESYFYYGYGPEYDWWR